MRINTDFNSLLNIKPSSSLSYTLNKNSNFLFVSDELDAENPFFSD
jgi:hypothetical protein